MSLIVGITGGIGSGKSTVCKVFEGLGIPVFKADDVSRSISDVNSSVIEKIKAAFGDDMYTDGKLNRPKMAALVFNDKEALAKLNSIIHPAVRQAFANWKEKNTEAPYLLYEAAILFESGAALLTDKKILVTASQETRIARVIQRDNITREEVESRIKNQWSDEQKTTLADYVLQNDDNAPVLQQALALDKILRTA